MIPRLAACGFGLFFVLAILLLVAIRTSGADFDNDWLLEDLTCDELTSGYLFEVEVLKQVKAEWDNCRAFADSPADRGHGALHCALLRKEGEFVQGMANDIVAVFNAKPECTGESP
jgi:hypothetical protein